MNAAHTPGAWAADKYGNSFVITAKDGAYDIAVIRNIGNENNEANARLIAAAPDLLAAMTALVALIDSGEGINTVRKGLSLQNARAAIARATLPT